MQELAIVERFIEIYMIKNAKGRNEEEYRHAEPRGYLEERRQMRIGDGIHQILRADVNADDAEHGNAANIFDGCEVLLWHEGTSLL